jgi:predicted PurR-regulated permease PerM
MDVPTEAVNALSDTQWGAILVLAVFVMCSFITYLMLQTRSLNRTIKEISDQRTDDAKEMYEGAQKMARESLETVNKATLAIENLGGKISELTTVILRWQGGDR